MKHLLDHPDAQLWLLLAIAVSSIVVAACAVVGLTILRLVSTQLLQKTSFSDQAQLLLDRGDLEGLIQMARARLSTFNDDAAAHYFIGLALYRQGDLRSALTYLVRIPKLHAGWDVQPMIQAIEKQLVELGEKPNLKIVQPTPPEGVS